MLQPYTTCNCFCTYVPRITAAVVSKLLPTMVDIINEVNSLTAIFETLRDAVHQLSSNLAEHKANTSDEIMKLQTCVYNAHNTTKVSLNLMNTTLLAEMATEMRQIDSTLDSHTTGMTAMKATTTQLSNEHQDLHNTILGMECINTENILEIHTNFENDLTHQLNNIQSGVKTILGPYTCGGTGGWRRVVDLDMASSRCTNCPAGWQLTSYIRRTCGRRQNGYRTCDSASFPVQGGEYSSVCGRIIAYQWGCPDGFRPYNDRYVNNIDGAYASGVSLTYGYPRQHIWTFAAGGTENNPSETWVCPCDHDDVSSIQVPWFVGTSYFCESGVNEAWDDRVHFNFHTDVFMGWANLSQESLLHSKYTSLFCEASANQYHSQH